MKLFAKFFPVILVSTSALAHPIWYSFENLKHADSEFCSYSITTPLIESRNGKNSYALEKINQAWKDKAQQLILDYNQLAKESLCNSHFESNILNLDFSLTTSLSSPVVSILFSQYYYLGGAHGYTERYSQIFNAETGESYDGLDSFISEQHFNDLVSFVENELINSHEVDPEFGWNEFKENHWTSMSAIKNFYLTPEGIVIFFNQYEVAPYAAGPIDIVLPWFEPSEDSAFIK